MKRLWILTELFPPEETSTSYYIGCIANAMTTKYKVGVICGPEVYDFKRKQTNDFPLSDKLEIIRVVPKIRLNKDSKIGKGLSFIIMTRLLYREAKKRIKDGDKVLVVTNPAPLIIMMSKLRQRIKFEYTILVQDIFPENTKAANINLPFYAYIKSIFDKAYSRADRLITNGRDMAQIVSGKTQDKVKCIVLENWGECKTIHPEAMPYGSKIIVAYTGNIGRVQGLEKIVCNVPDEIDLHFYGSGASEDSLKALNKKNVFFHGPFKRSEQSKIIGSCHISLVTLSEDMYGLGVPSKSYNIIAAGRPIVYFGPPNSEIELMIKENGIGYCGWPDKWDTETLKEMGERARKLSEARYSEDVILEKYVKIL